MSETEPYTALARIYDHVMEHVEYRKWALYIIDLFKFAQVKVRTILELSCGTGEFLRSFNPDDFMLFASDLSVDMLIEMRKKNVQGIPVFAADSANLPIRSELFDAVLVLYDSINYHLETEALYSFMHDVHRILRPHGLLIFDTVTPTHCANYFNNEMEEQYWDNRGYHRKSKFDADTNLQLTEFAIHIAGEEFIEYHRQRIYEMAELEQIATKENFQILAMLDEFTLKQANDDSGRIHVVCRKI